MRPKTIFPTFRNVWLTLLVSLLLTGAPLWAQTPEAAPAPASSEPAKAEPSKTDPSKPEPGSIEEPATAEPGKSEPELPVGPKDDVEDLYAPDQPIKKADPKTEAKTEPPKSTEPVLYISDTDNGRIVVMQGLKGEGFISLGLPGYGFGRFLRPAQIWVDYAGRVHVADSGNNRVIRINQNAQSNEPGWTEVDGLSEPRGVAVDGTAAYVSDTKANRIVVYDEIVTKAKPREILTHPLLKRPADLWIDASGALYICCGEDPPGGRVLKTWMEKGIAEKEGAEAKSTRRWAIYSGDGLSGSRFLPTSMVTAKSGLRLLDISGQRVISMSDFNGKKLREDKFRLDPRWRLSRPGGIAVDKDGRTFIADSGNDRILEIGPTGEVLGEYEMADDDTGTLLANPSSIFIFSPAPGPPAKEDEEEGKGKGKGKSKPKPKDTKKANDDLEFDGGF